MSRGSKLQNFVGSQTKLSQLLVMLKPFSKELFQLMYPVINCGYHNSCSNKVTKII